MSSRANLSLVGRENSNRNVPPFLSIELVCQRDPTLPAVLRSVQSQGGELNLELIVVTNAPDIEQSILEGVGSRCCRVKVIVTNTELLRARLLGLSECHGEFVMLLDGTRPIAEGLAESIHAVAGDADLIVVPEQAIGDSRWARLGGIDKLITSSPANTEQAFTKQTGVVMPRVFRGSLIREAARKIINVIPPGTIDKIVHGDHQLITRYALAEGSRIVILKEMLIAHFEDSTISVTVRKYFRYGRSAGRVATTVPGLALASLPERRRKLRNIPKGSYIRVQPLYFARSISFLSGYLVGRLSSVGPGVRNA